MTDKEKIRADAARKKAALAASKKLYAAAEAVGHFSMACVACADASAPRADDDGRRLLVRNMNEYAGYLESVYDK